MKTGPPLFFAAYALYVVCCIAYELCCPAVHDAAKKVRSHAWDVVKFVLIFVVILGHTTAFVVDKDDKPYPGSAEDLWVHIWKMPAFVLISGIFGSNVSVEAISKMLCYTVGTAFIFGSAQIVFGSHQWLKIWYLYALAFWRVTVAPVMSSAACSASRWTQAATLVVVWVASYAASPPLMRYDPADWGLPDYAKPGFLPKLSSYAPVFAVGLCMPPELWRERLSGPPGAALCAAAVGLWYVGCSVARSALPGSSFEHFFFPPSSSSGPRAWFRPPNLLGVVESMTVYATVLLVSVAVIGLILAAASRLESRAPWLASCIGGLGSRTLYAYVLQTCVVDVNAWHSARAAREFLSPVFGSIPAQWRGAAVLIFALQFTIVSSCRWTERVFHLAVMPVWILDLFRWALRKLHWGTNVVDDSSETNDTSSDGSSESDDTSSETIHN